MTAPAGTPDPVASLIGRPPWMARAACRNTDTATFFPRRGEPSDAALAVCSHCPCRGPCLEFALAEPMITGVWGGTTGKERRAMREPAGPVEIRHGTAAGYSLEQRRHLPHCPNCRRAHAEANQRGRAFRSA